MLWRSQESGLRWRPHARGARFDAVADERDENGGEPEEPGEPEEDEDGRERVAGARFRRRLSEQLTGLLDPEGAIRRGHGLVSGVTQATKEEVMRIVSSEVRSFLDKMDAVDLLQQVVAGLVVDVDMQIKFSREAGKLQPEVTSSSTRISAAESNEDDAEGGGSGNGNGNGNGRGRGKGRGNG